MQKEGQAQYHLLPLRIGTMYNLYDEGHKGQLSLVLVPSRIFTPQNSSKEWLSAKCRVAMKRMQILKKIIQWGDY